MTRFHSAWCAVVTGVALILVAGCSQSAPTHDVATTCSSPAPGGVAVTAALRDGRADPAPQRVQVPRDARVQLTVTSDHDVEVHLHGYDLAYEAGPGGPGCIAFTADLTGLFDVEAHPDTLLVQLEVR